MEIPKGFNLEETGGGCTALVSNNRRFYIVQGDPIAPDNMDDPCTVGFYDENEDFVNSKDFESVTDAISYISDTGNGDE